MSTPSPTSPPRRPRLSLQIRHIANGPTGRTSRSLAAAVDVKSPTSFNTLSNVYATAVDRSTPVQEKAPQTVLGGRPSLRLQTQDSSVPKERRLQTPYLGPYLDTPVTAQPMSPAIPKQVYFPSAMAATPPMSAVPPEHEGSRVFTFDDSQPTPMSGTPSSSGRIPQSSGSQQPRRSKTMPANCIKPPYTHPRSLRSILRNSPLPPLSTKSPESPRRQSLRLQEKAARRVAYNSPLCQTITTSKYTRSHIDLLADDTTPTTPSATSTSSASSASSSDNNDTTTNVVLDQTMAYSNNETRDGGQTPGPFEEMRRRMAGLRASTPTALSPTSAGGIRKRGSGGGKKREKKRRWVWTIGQDGEDADEMGSPVVGPGETTRMAVDVPAVNVPRKEVAVPVIAVPLPKPRTRMQTATAKRNLALQSLIVPAVTAPAPVEVIQPLQEQVTVTHAPIVTTTFTAAAAAAAAAGKDRITPEPVTAVQAIEPPTPSVESVASVSTSQDSVFEAHHGGDVEMSDASSMFSDADPGDYYHHPADAKTDMNMGSMGMNDVNMDVDMDTATPTTATVQAGEGFNYASAVNTTTAAAAATTTITSSVPIQGLSSAVVGFQ